MWCSRCRGITNICIRRLDVVVDRIVPYEEANAFTILSEGFGRLSSPER